MLYKYKATVWEISQNVRGFEQERKILKTEVKNKN